MLPELSIQLNLAQAIPRIYGVVYKNVALKADMGQIKFIASKFEENASIPADKFTVPSDYQIIEQKIIE